jgi:hypothetical protein
VPLDDVPKPGIPAARVTSPERSICATSEIAFRPVIGAVRCGLSVQGEVLFCGDVLWLRRTLSGSWSGPVERERIGRHGGVAVHGGRDCVAADCVVVASTCAWRALVRPVSRSADPEPGCDPVVAWCWMSGTLMDEPTGLSASKGCVAWCQGTLWGVRRSSKV